MRPTRLGVFGAVVAGEGRERPLVACWILVMLTVLLPAFALVPVVVLLGYLLRLLEASADGESAPRFAVEFRSLVTGGLAAFGISVGYLAVPLLALLITFYGAVTSLRGSDLAAGESLLIYGGSTAVLGLFIAAAYLTPAALAVYADTGSIKRAFSPRALRPIAGHAAYFARWMAGAVALGMSASLANVALQIHRVGHIVASLVVAYGLLLATHVWGLGVRRARERQ